jgi:hypothetical protein
MRFTREGTIEGGQGKLFSKSKKLYKYSIFQNPFDRGRR